MESTAVASRRDFLLAAGLGAGAAAVVAATRGRSDAAPTEVAVKPADGYRVSPHIVKYYRTAAI